MNLSQRPPGKNKIAVALLYPPSLIEVNLTPFVTMSADGEMTVIDNLTEPQKACPTYKNFFDKGLITRYALTMCHQDGQVLYNASVNGNSAEILTGVL